MAVLSLAALSLNDIVDVDKHTVLTRVLNLPRELRDLVWTHILQRRGSTKLLRVNKQIHQEAISVLYRIKTVRILTPEDFRNFAAIGKTNGRNASLRYLELAIDCLYINNLDPRHCVVDLGLFPG